MSETLDAPVQTEQTTEVTPPAFSPFKDNNWVETIPTQQAVETTAPAATTVATEVITPNPAEEIFDENVYVKTKYGWESPEAGIKELEDLRKFKEKPFDFTNDDSRKAFEYLKEGKEEDLYKILDQKRRVNKLLSAETIDESVADQIIKMGMQTRYKDLTQEEIEYKFKKQFSIPSKPVQIDVESDEEYAQKVSNWEATVSDIRMEKIIEAKVARPELEKLKMELVLPDIPRVNPEAAAPSQESLAEMQKVRDNFLAKLNSGYTTFKGYETKVKDESGEIPVAFVVPDEEKVAQRLKVENLELDVYFNKRWFDENNNPNVEKIMADLYLLENPEKVFQGIANNAANQKLVQYIKQTSNINVTEGPKGTMVANTTQDDINKQIEYIWKQK